MNDHTRATVTYCMVTMRGPLACSLARPEKNKKMLVRQTLESHLGHDKPHAVIIWQPKALQALVTNNKGTLSAFVLHHVASPAMVHLCSLALSTLVVLKAINTLVTNKHVVKPRGHTGHLVKIPQVWRTKHVDERPPKCRSCYMCCSTHL